MLPWKCEDIVMVTVWPWIPELPVVSYLRLRVRDCAYEPSLAFGVTTLFNPECIITGLGKIM